MAGRKEPAFKLVYQFDAPKKRVFNAFANADALNAWWGPVATKNTVVKLEFHVGGIFHFKMDMNGKVSYGRFLFIKIEPFDLLEFTNAFADEQARVVKPPFDIRIPLEIFYRLEFTESSKKTTITLTGDAVDASPEELEGLRSINASMQEGFGATFKKLEDYLARS